ncbi:MULTISPECIES: biotin-dependent carboxyltransferase family protein [Rodentibacter]|uniref:5-oxoprolinase subunit C family protein n=1 Tax=Rodentibacter TaxID=1960084 RepID=UPI001CFDD31A|nr:biotin-dependent carboxyltransferase family protein [Rodentibacter sp. JRC1]GJI56882.1 hypothetical protein HEMROJRC1_19940 [Rodentibacter sp. JRC1]
MIYIQSLQAFAHIQDLGRLGYRGQGIGQAGAMDKLALKAGNLLLQNAPECPAIEFAMGGLTLTFDCATPFCLTGALCEATLDNQPIFPYWRYTAKARQTLHIKRITTGNYGYLCVAGGINVPLFLNSASTDLNAKFGGFYGRLLKKGDHLATGKRDTYLSPLGIEPINFCSQIHALVSSEYEAFEETSQQAFWQQAWTIQTPSGRMGYRLQGEALRLRSALEMLSHAVPMGTIQVPPDGQPIVLMADAQTTGGYPKIGCVIQADLGRLAQQAVGSSVRFTQVDRQTAQRLSQQDELYLDNIRRKANATR